MKVATIHMTETQSRVVQDRIEGQMFFTSNLEGESLRVCEVDESGSVAIWYIDPEGEYWIESTPYGIGEGWEVFDATPAYAWKVTL